MVGVCKVRPSAVIRIVTYSIYYRDTMERLKGVLQGLVGEGMVTKWEQVTLGITLVIAAIKYLKHVEGYYIRLLFVKAHSWL